MSDVVLITPPVDRIIITQPAPRVLRETLGPPGPQGPQGVQGPQGAQGPAGADGAGLVWRGAWNSGTAYVLNDVVSYNGSSFVAIQAGMNHAPAVGGTAYWQDIADKGDVGAQGPVGPQGPQGPQGAVGAQGPQGVRGIGNSTFSLTGVLAVTVGQGRFVLVGAATITSVIASVGTAPTGASIIVDVKKNGVSVFGAGPKPTIAAGANVSAAVVPATTALADGDYLTVDVTQVGSGTPGADLTVQTYLS